MLLHPKHKMTVWYIWIAQSLRFHNFNHTFGWVLNVILDWSNIFFHLSATAWCPIGRRCPLSGVGSRGGSDPRLSSQPTSQSSDGEARAQNWPPPPRDVNVPPGRLLISRGASLSASSIREPGNPATPPSSQVLGCLARRQWGVSCEWNGAKMGCSRSAEPSH